MPVRFFEPAQSQQYVPTYAPLPVDVIGQGVEGAYQTHERGQEALDAFADTQQSYLDSLTPENQQAAQQILQKDAELVDELSGSDSEIPYQDMETTIRRRARQTQAELQPYLKDSERVRSFQDEVDEMYDAGDLSLGMRNYYNRQLGDYQGLEFDDRGRPQGFEAPPLIRKVDINDQIDEFMDHIASGNEQVAIEQLGGDEAFVKEIRTRGRSPEDMERIRELVTARVLNNTENQQYLQAEYLAESDRRERAGEEPIEMDEFVEDFVSPYSYAASMPQTIERVRNNPRFSASGSGGVEGLGMLTGSLEIGQKELDMGTPAAIRDSIADHRENYDVQKRLAQRELGDIGIDYTIDDETGKIIVDDPVVDGVDHSAAINDLQQTLRSSRRNIQNLERYDRQAREQAGLGEPDEAESRNKQTLERSYELWIQNKFPQLQGPEGVRSNIDIHEQAAERPELWEEFRNSTAYRNALEGADDSYKKYLDILHENSKGGHRETPVASLGKTGDRQMEDYLMRHDPVLEDGKTREQIQDEDREELNLKDAVYTGVFTDEGGALKAAYQVYDDDGRNPRLVLTDAPPMARQLMLKAGNYDDFDSYTYSQLAGLSSRPGAEGRRSLQVTDEEGEPIRNAELEVRMLSRGEQTALGRSRPGQEPQYEVMMSDKDGNKSRGYARSMDEIIPLYRRYFQKVNNIDDGQQ